MGKVVVLQICPVCNLAKQVDIPVWREDVEGWGYERIPCPLCGGEGALTREQWAERLKELQHGKRT